MLLIAAECLSSLDTVQVQFCLRLFVFCLLLLSAMMNNTYRKPSCRKDSRPYCLMANCNKFSDSC